MACRGVPGHHQGTEDTPLELGPAQMVADVLQDHREQKDLEGECGQVLVEEEYLLHQEEQEVVHGLATSTQHPRQHPVQPGILGEVMDVSSPSEQVPQEQQHVDGQGKAARKPDHYVSK
ncbi:hypothetical protein P7K49_017409 [Saguinus oedipus]|uniref:Uncharacterized protein n=1 Tax=Saguinus oedipus TaxID=9490 RepID=A0ABQ9V4A9_SAGOE|nr:hypothetical protein P7K49_017409 [Saguinus oedipus]